MKNISSFRQLLFPREFRINQSTWPTGLVADLDEFVKNLSKRDTEGMSTTFISEVGTDLWRLRQKMLQPGTDQPLIEMRRAFRHLESLWEALAQAGVQILDHTGELVPEGGEYGLKVLAYQPKAGTTHNQVLETIKPTIYYHNKMIQMGEVIICEPEREEPYEQNDH